MKRISQKSSKRIEPETARLPNETLQESRSTMITDKMNRSGEKIETKIPDRLREKNFGCFDKLAEAFDFREEIFRKRSSIKNRRQQFFDDRRRSRQTQIPSKAENCSKLETKKTKIFARFVSENAVEKMDDVLPKIKSQSGKTPLAFHDEKLSQINPLNQQLAVRTKRSHRSRMHHAKRSKEISLESVEFSGNEANPSDDQNETQEAESSSMSATAESQTKNSSKLTKFSFSFE